MFFVFRATLRSTLALSLIVLSFWKWGDGIDAAASPNPKASDSPATKSNKPSLPEPLQQGSNFFQANQLEEAGQTWRKALSLARREANQAQMAALLIQLGNIQTLTENFADARKFYSESAEIAEKRQLHALAARAYASAARNAIQQGDPDDAITLLRVAYGHVTDLPETRDKAELTLAVGHLAQQNAGSEKRISSDLEWTYRALTAGTKLAEVLQQDDLRAYGYGYLGSLYLAQQRLDEAEVYTRRAEFIAQAIHRPDILYRWQWQSGRILAKRDAREQAMTAYRRAAATLQPISQAIRKLTVLDTPNSATELYAEMADLFLQQANLSDNDLLALRGLIEQGKVAELEDYYRDDCVSAWLSKKSGIDRVADRSAALYPIQLNDRLELLLSLPDGIERYTVRQSRAEVRRQVEQFRVLLENRGTPEFLPYAQALYGLLIKPLESALVRDHIDTLVFVPDVSFRTVPLAALHDGEDFLVRRYAVGTAPGLTLTDPKPIQRERAQALILGLSDGGPDFAPLPYVAEEIRQVAEQFPGTVLSNGAFRLSIVERQLLENSYRIVHIASHGQFGRTLQSTFVQAADGRISIEALGTMMGVNRYRDDPIELLTLSACQTAAGDDQAALGLAGVAVKAGARSALASLWYINDSASANLVTEFYRQLKKPGRSKAQALQRAQWSLMDNPRYDHPGYWAPFLMIGNWL